MPKITNIDAQSGSFLPLSDQINKVTPSNAIYRSSLEQCADAQEASGPGCCQSMGSCFMRVIDCILTPFKDLLDWIVWVICCGETNQIERFNHDPQGTTKELAENPQKFANKFVADLKNHLGKMLASFKALEENKKQMQENWDKGLYILPFIGSQFEERVKEEIEKLAIQNAMINNKSEEEYEFFTEAENLGSLMNPEQIFYILSDWILELQKNAEKDSPAFRKLVIAHVFRVYLEQFNVDKGKFPLIAAIYSEFDELLKDEKKADEWTKVFLDAMEKIKRPVVELDHLAEIPPLHSPVEKRPSRPRGLSEGGWNFGTIRRKKKKAKES